MCLSSSYLDFSDNVFYTVFSSKLLLQLSYLCIMVRNYTVQIKHVVFQYFTGNIPVYLSQTVQKDED